MGWMNRERKLSIMKREEGEGDKIFRSLCPPRGGPCKLDGLHVSYQGEERRVTKTMGTNQQTTV